MTNHGWQNLLAQTNVFCGDGEFPIPAYSEFMPGPYLGLKPYGGIDPFTVPPAGDAGWRVSEYQEAHQLRPGLELIGRHLLGELRKLGEGQQALPKVLLTDNPYWPETLAARAGALAHERYAVLLPLALSRTLDDKGRVRWTFFGGSEQGPARAFWHSFRTAPDRALSEKEGLAMVRALLERIYDLTADEVKNLHRAGFRILPVDRDPDFPAWSQEPMPNWARAYVLGEKASLRGVRYLLTFRPFARLPMPVQKAYLSGALHLLPFPGSLIFFGHRGYRKLARELPLAMQIPLLRLFPGNHAAPMGIRILQSGWLDEPHPHGAAAPMTHTHGPVVSHVKRTHRWNRTRRDEKETDVIEYEDRVTDVLFSTNPEHLGLYGKPMARNAQIWTHDHHLLLNGPVHGRARIDEATRALAAGGHFGYRFFFPPMRVGHYEVYWHRPLIAFFPPDAVEPTVLPDGPLGYLTAYARAGESLLTNAPVELWPRLDRREPHRDAVELFEREPPGHRRYTTTYNIRKLLEAYELLGGKPLLRSFARQLLTVPKEITLDQWLDALPERATNPARGHRLARALRQRIRSADRPLAVDTKTRLPRAHTFGQTARRRFEEQYWKTIAYLAEGRYVHKNNADLAGAHAGARAARDLEALGDYLYEYYRERIAHHGMMHKALIGNHWFRWATDFDFPWSEGWSRNQLGQARERNIVVIIPGQDRSRTVIMGDHYDTAYMEDVYEPKRGRKFRRAAAAGADDNHSATAALMLAADVSLPLSRAGKLKHDIWLVHLTGEEFPSDCLGARNLTQRLVERNFAIHAEDAGWIDLSVVRVRGAYILDMVAHNNDHVRNVFQIAPGEGPEAMRLAFRAHLANERWNHAVPIWNSVPKRKRAAPYKRVESGNDLPAIAAHPCLSGKIRPSWHFTSSLYNTDAQIFSDAGIPVVLFMEHYDINRRGYHDTQDTMKNIDLDYGAALVAIAIETVADVASAGDL
jgi:hypothetical protein